MAMVMVMVMVMIILILILIIIIIIIIITIITIIIIIIITIIITTGAWVTTMFKASDGMYFLILEIYIVCKFFRDYSTHVIIDLVTRHSFTYGNRTFLCDQYYLGKRCAFGGNIFMEIWFRTIESRPPLSTAHPLKQNSLWIKGSLRGEWLLRYRLTVSILFPMIKIWNI